ncbi:MAG: 4'-phosphopantetheinyl transferase superfamily protein [Ruminococcaceae bacterium]|nr:4'-phosphopantetheinyl transferase superfamily protein [Oscillospiraceae bacterium]
MRIFNRNPKGRNCLVKVFVTDIASLADPSENLALIDRLPTYRKEKILSLKKEADRKQSLGAGLLLRYALNKHGFSDADVFVGDNGKPICPGVGFNLSHSFDKILCAVGQGDLGCDVEKIRHAPRRRIRRFFSLPELEYLSCTSEWDRTFFQLWTAKESYLKMTGEGLRKAPTSFSVLAKDVSLPCIFQKFEDDGYIFSVCAMEEIENRLIYVSDDELFT